MDKRLFSCHFSEDMLEAVTDYLLRTYVGAPARDLRRVCIVSGGRRPFLFLSRLLARKIGGSYLPPHFFTMDEFIAECIPPESRVPVADSLESCYLIYRLVLAQMPEIMGERTSFVQFLPWAREIAVFFEQLDLEAIDASRLAHIPASAAIGYDVPDTVNRLLQHLSGLRERFRNALRENGRCTRAERYLRAAGLADTIDFPAFSEILFLGPYFLHETEKRLIGGLVRRRKATVFVYNDEGEWPGLQSLANACAQELSRPEPTGRIPQIAVHAGFDAHSQAMICRDVVESLPRDHTTVVVLAQEEHLIPFLSITAAALGEFNVSMGYPLQRSGLAGLFLAMIEAQRSREPDRYYTPDYLRVLSHPLVAALIPEVPAAAEAFCRVLRSAIEGATTGPFSSSVFLDLSEIESDDGLLRAVMQDLSLPEGSERSFLEHAWRTVHTALFRDWESLTRLNSLATAVQSFIHRVFSFSDFAVFALNRQAAHALTGWCDTLRTVPFSADEFPPEDVLLLFEDWIREQKIAFSGTPLKGIQVLGLLETRSLCFEQVVIVDANEQLLPKVREMEPLIPREIMIGLGINRLEIEETIQRYQFLRLISAARQVHVLYDDSPEKQRSRFVEELIWREERRSRNLSEGVVAAFQFRAGTGKKREAVEKSPGVQERLRQLSFSPSSLNTYIRCPLRFYYQYIMTLPQWAAPIQEVEPAFVGTFVHSLLENWMQPLVHTVPQLPDSLIRQWMQDFERRFEESFGRRLRADSLLLREVLRHALQNFLAAEQQRCRQQVRELIAVEQFATGTVQCACRTITVRAKIDRIDLLNDGTLLVLDYKTGDSDKPPAAAGRLGRLGDDYSRESIRRTVRSFQLPLYCYLVKMQYADQPIQAALYNVRTHAMNFFPAKKETADFDQLMGYCLDALSFIVGEIFDPAVPLEAVRNPGNCDYCPYAKMCF